MRKQTLAAIGLALVAAATTSSRATAGPGLYVGRSDARLENKATHVVVMRDGGRTILSIQSEYTGPREPFAMVVPVPVTLAKEHIRTLKMDSVEALDRLTAPRLVEYWEQDPCGAASAPRLKPPLPEPRATRSQATDATDASAPRRAGPDLGVFVPGTYVAGEYDVVIVPSQDVVARLRQEGYAISPDAEDSFRPYVEAGSNFVVAKVDVSKLTFDGGRAALSPLRLTYDEPELTLPVRLGLASASGPQDLVIDILADGTRYELAGAPGVTIPTNLDVAESVKASFSSFYGALFEKTLEKTLPPIVTEYAWGATTCDPCPGPPLSGYALATFGDDVLPPDTNPHHVSVVLPRGVVKEPLTRAASAALASALGTCFQPIATKAPELRGVIDIALSYDGSGDGKTITFVKDEIQRPELVACVKAQAGTVHVPAPGAAGSATLSFTVTSRAEPKWRDWTVTRLHARYDKSTFAADLQFKEAPAIAGGREIPGDGGAVERGVSAPSTNTFQARYAIRHPWAGPMACAAPRRGVWGPAPQGASATSDAGAAAASRLAFLDKSRPVDLAKLVTSDAPAIDLHGPPAGAAPDGGVGAPAAPAAKDGSARGCGGCGIGAVGVVLVVAGRRRKRSRPAS